VYLWRPVVARGTTRRCTPLYPAFTRRTAAAHGWCAPGRGGLAMRRLMSHITRWRGLRGSGGPPVGRIQPRARGLCPVEKIRGTGGYPGVFSTETQGATVEPQRRRNRFFLYRVAALIAAQHGGAPCRHSAPTGSGSPPGVHDPHRTRNVAIERGGCAIAPPPRMLRTFRRISRRTPAAPASGHTSARRRARRRVLTPATGQRASRVPDPCRGCRRRTRRRAGRDRARCRSRGSGRSSQASYKAMHSVSSRLMVTVSGAACTIFTTPTGRRGEPPRCCGYGRGPGRGDPSGRGCRSPAPRAHRRRTKRRG